MTMIKRDFDLIDLNTFGIHSVAREYGVLTSTNELEELCDTDLPIFILGGGSNLLLPEKLNRRVILNAIPGIEIIDSQNDHVMVRVGSGVNWHEFVLWSLAQDLGGIENLSLIPGKVGAAPIQNIGAYGVELKEVCQAVHFTSIESGEVKTYSNQECEFGYRNSVFKNELKHKTCITSVDFKLTHAAYHEVNIEYGAIRKELEQRGISEPRISDVSSAVIDIRSSKLPDPAEIGNSGSFFKNAVVSVDKLESLKSSFSNIVYYPMDDYSVKVPTGWLIENAGWKGKRIGNAGCYNNQALVLVNLGEATSSDIRHLAQEIRKSVEDKFGILIQPEVNILD